MYPLYNFVMKTRFFSRMASEIFAALRQQQLHLDHNLNKGCTCWTLPDVSPLFHNDLLERE